MDRFFDNYVIDADAEDRRRQPPRGGAIATARASPTRGRRSTRPTAGSTARSRAANGRRATASASPTARPRPRSSTPTGSTRSARHSRTSAPIAGGCSRGPSFARAVDEARPFGRLPLCARRARDDPDAHAAQRNEHMPTVEELDPPHRRARGAPARRRGRPGDPPAQGALRAARGRALPPRGARSRRAAAASRPPRARSPRLFSATASGTAAPGSACAAGATRSSSACASRRSRSRGTSS